MMQQSGNRRGRRLMAEINVVPYIDVMLVLLIIFKASRSICRRPVRSRCLQKIRSR
jgi:biopolymer transport protein TolR